MGFFTYVLRNYCLDTGSSVAADNDVNGFRDDNLREFPVARPWRSNNDLSVNVRYNLGSSRAIDFAAVLNHNVRSSGSITLQRANNSSGPWTDVGDLDLNPWIGKASWYLRSSTINYRHWRLQFADSGNPDGYIEAGLIVLGASVELPWLAERPYTVERGISQRANNSEEQSPIIGATLSERSLLSVSFIGMSQAQLNTTEAALASFNLGKNPVAILPDGDDGNELFFGRLAAPQVVIHEQGGTKTINDLPFWTDPYGVRA